MGKAESHCLRCGGVLVRGSLRVSGAYDARVSVKFVIPGVPTSSNPIRAFKQGLAGETDDEVIDLSEVASLFCRACGYLELRAWIDDDPGEV